MLVDTLKTENVEWSKIAAWVWTSGIISAVLGHSSATKAKNGEQGWLGYSLNTILFITVPIFLASLVIGLSAGLDRLLIQGSSERWTGFFSRSTWLHHWLSLATVLMTTVAASWFVNINWFSLHGLYRNRLIRAFLGASNPQRFANPFIGFDQKDNPQVAELWRPRDTCRAGADVCWQPFHVINIALNLVSSKRLAWQERKAASFTISPLHSGWHCDDKPRFSANTRVRTLRRPPSTV
jgi:hypothetical protein